MRSILITGGAGFIGSHLVDRLLSEGEWQVSVVDDFNDFYDPTIKRANASRSEPKSSYRLFEADIRDQSALEEIFAANSFDCIVHLAARAGVRPSLEQPLLYAETNINGTMNLLEMARAHAVKQFVFGSSSSVYGINAKVPFSEDDPIRQPISPYAATKAAGELLCHTYTHLYGMRCSLSALFYGLRSAPASRSGDSQIRAADQRRANQSRFLATARRAAITRSSTTSSRACGPRSITTRATTK